MLHLIRYVQASPSIHTWIHICSWIRTNLGSLPIPNISRLERLLGQHVSNRPMPWHFPISKAARTYNKAYTVSRTSSLRADPNALQLALPARISWHLEYFAVFPPEWCSPKTTQHMKYFILWCLDIAPMDTHTSLTLAVVLGEGSPILLELCM